MRKFFTITFLVILILFLILHFCGLEKRFFYVNSENNYKNISILKCPEFFLQLTANPENKNLTDFHIDLIFNNLTQNIVLENANVSIINNPKSEIKLIEVTATDGFYNWDAEKNGKAETFEKLPTKLKEISKEIRAYYLYSWNFKTNGMEKKDLEIRVLGNLLIEGKRKVFERNIKMKLTNKIVFRSPIRFH